MYIENEDYIQVGAEALKIMQNCDDGRRDKAEQRAVSEVSSYLRYRYDVDKTFTKTGTDRDPALVGYVADIALFYMVCSLPGRMGYEIRKDQFEKAIAFLKEVQKGNATLDIPTILGPSGEEDYNNPISYDCGIKNKYDW